MATARDLFRAAEKALALGDREESLGRDGTTYYLESIARGILAVAATVGADSDPAGPVGIVSAAATPVPLLRIPARLDRRRHDPDEGA